MFNFKEEIAKKIADVLKLEYTEILKRMEVPKEDNMGDYAFPCFRLAKTLRKSPQAIAEEIKEKMDLGGDFIEKQEGVNRIS